MSQTGEAIEAGDLHARRSTPKPDRADRGRCARRIVMSGCGSTATSVRGKQPDLLLHTQRGAGSTTLADVRFPLAKFTFFADSDPEDCLQALAVLGPDGAAVAQAQRPAPPAGVSVAGSCPALGRP